MTKIRLDKNKNFNIIEKFKYELLYTCFNILYCIEVTSYNL